MVIIAQIQNKPIWVENLRVPEKIKPIREINIRAEREEC